MDINGEEMVQANLRDITESKRAEEALRRSEEMFRALVSHAPFGIIVATPQRRVDYINPAVTAMLGYTIEDVPDADAWWARAYPDPAYRAEVAAVWNAIDQNTGAMQGTRDRTFRVRHKNGTDRYIRFMAVSERRTVAGDAAGHHRTQTGHGTTAEAVTGRRAKPRERRHHQPERRNRIRQPGLHSRHRL
jgi:PAS domain S-box-containing protein